MLYILNTNRSMLIGFIVFSFFISMMSSSCAGQNEIVENIENDAELIRSGNVDILDSISDKKLRVAKDSEYGTLYYAGLLWYFQDKVDTSIIAFKRSARTSPDPWSTESARIVGNLYVSTFDYGPLFDFYDSLNTVDFFASDPELFYYYAISAWSLRKYNVLAELVQAAKTATWRKSPKNRIRVLEARFSLQLWGYLLEVIDEKNTSLVALERLLLENDAYPIVYSIPFFLERVSDILQLSDNVELLIKAKTLFLDDRKVALEVYFDLPQKFFLHYNTLEDIISVARHSRKGLQDVQKRLVSELSHDDTITQEQKMNLLASLAYILYLRNNYRDSAKYYRKLFDALDDHVNPKKYSNNTVSMFLRAFRSFLYIVAKQNPEQFISQYQRFATLSSRPSAFAGSLEEYLHTMIHERRYLQLAKDLQTLETQFTHPAILLQLGHWRTLLSMANVSEQNSILKEQPSFIRSTYQSVFAYDFLLAESESNTVDDEYFFTQYFIPKNANKETDTKSDVDILVEGHIKFGLFDYAHSISLANISIVSFKHIKRIYEFFSKKQRYYDAYLLANKSAYFTPEAFLMAQDVSLIYPQAYKEIIHGLTKNVFERVLLFALMREESSYSPTIRSTANAVGLTQLLYTTAEDIAKRIDYGNFSIQNPKDNLTLGYEYFKYLNRVLKNPIKAILAYNGGLGNIWKWEKIFDTSNMLLFSAQVPFKETRRYVRKVLSSAMIYGMLYYDISPNDFLVYVKIK